jgi:Ca2+-binding RTX toxin-like protein
MWGNGGDDTFIVDNAGDRVFETAGKGLDTILTSVSHRLEATAEVEVLSAADPSLTTAIDLIGNALVNALTGNAGANRLTGGGGADRLTGGGGADIFVFAATADAGDVITDFAVGSDKLDVSALLRSVGYAGSDPFADGYLRAVPSASGSDILFDANGGADGFVTLAQLSGVSAASLTPDSYIL